jgi:hypothetical protein
MAQKLISMSETELFRYEVIQQLINKEINGTDASKQLGLCLRQVKRLKIKVIKSGAQGLIHGNRGRQSSRQLDTELVEKAKGILQNKYYDFGPSFASEKLEENDNIKINRESLRLIMTEMDLWQPKPRKQAKKKHFWRARKDNFGEMQQFDGSYHIWFGDFESCLLLSVDDATGKITHGQFDYNESVMAVFDFWWGYLEKNGLPLSIYLDKFSTYKINHPQAVDNSELMTQFQRAMNQVGVKPITAHSAQAKGRIERMFETLQDRLVKELRLAGVTTIEEANKFLIEYIPKFNAKFAVIPARRKNLHKKLSSQLKEKLPAIFSIQKIRQVNNDYTVMFEKKFYQLNEVQPTTVYKKDAVIVEKHLSGKIEINLKGHYLDYFELPQRPKKEIDVKLPAITKKKQSHWKPPIDHPWRKHPFIVSKSINVEKMLSGSKDFFN